MTENATEEKIPVASKQVSEDLSKEIEQSMEHQPHVRIKVVRVFDDFYRCNWWKQDKPADAFWLATGTIIKSRFIRATKTGEGLVIKNAP